ncbi:MAG: hypothetical protein ACLP4W_08755 [Mycobacterium sp.]|uniref:hypothetical protein n=1 Tax=Mycobacterium sp. TaxID=1785 RepID=UPI003F9E177F
MTATTKGHPVKKRPAQIKIPRVCERCQRRLSDLDRMNAMGQFRDGFITGTVCNSCLTIEELADMTILECTREAGLNVDGRILNRSRRFENPAAGMTA